MAGGLLYILIISIKDFFAWSLFLDGRKKESMDRYARCALLADNWPFTPSRDHQNDSVLPHSLVRLLASLLRSSTGFAG